MAGYFLYLLTPWCRVLLEKLTGLQLVKRFPAFHGPRRFVTTLTSVRQLFLSWASPIQSIYPHPTSWRSILILSTHLRLGLPSSVLPSGFPTKTLYTPLSLHNDFSQLVLHLVQKRGIAYITQSHIGCLIGDTSSLVPDMKVCGDDNLCVLLTVMWMSVSLNIWWHQRNFHLNYVHALVLR